MILAVHQPHYMPWPGYMAKVMAADAFVYLDVVRYSKGDWQNRQRMIVNGRPKWLTVPVRQHTVSFTLLRDVAIAQPWALKHHTTIKQAYAARPWMAEFEQTLDNLYRRFAVREQLMTVALEMTQYLMVQLFANTPMHIASDLLALWPTDPDDGLIALCRVVGADTYLAGTHGRDYMNLDAWKRAGIKVKWCEYEPQPYDQGIRKFYPYAGTLDMLLNTGGIEAHRLIEQGTRIT